jgi:DNA-binding IclR family transcriptional regulator
MPRTGGESLISRVVRVLEAFDRTTEPLALSTLSNRTGLPLPTVYRLVTELARYGVLERTPDKRIRIGIHLWELSAQGNRGTSVRDAALPFMIDLRAALHEIVAVSVLDKGTALFLERLAPPETTLEAGRMAERHPLHASSAGLVLLAFRPVEEQQRVLTGPLERITEETVTDPARLRRTLADARRRRMVCLPGIGATDWTALAVPVAGPGDEVVAALSLIYHRGTEKPLKHAPAMHTAALGIARVLGRGEAGPSSQR